MRIFRGTIEFEKVFEPSVVFNKEMEDIISAKSGFQPKLKKLLVSMVRSPWSGSTPLDIFNLEF